MNKNISFSRSSDSNSSDNADESALNVSRSFIKTSRNIEQHKSSSEVISNELVQKRKKIQEKRRTKFNSDDKKSIKMFLSRLKLCIRNISKNKEANYEEKIKTWLKEISKIKEVVELFNVASQCDNLKIIIDFDDEVVEKSDETQNNSFNANHEIYVNVSRINDREQEIKGILAHELCHFVMRLVYENNCVPYYKYSAKKREEFELITKEIKKEVCGSEDDLNKDQNSGLNNIKNIEIKDDECNGIISTVFQLYEESDFHIELIVRVVHILAYFNNDENKSKTLESKYKILFHFWKNHVMPDLQGFNYQNRVEIRKINNDFGLFSSILELKIDFNSSFDIEELANNKLVIVTSNIPKLLIADITKSIEEKYGNFYDAKNIFVDPKHLSNLEVKRKLQRISKVNPDLTIIIDCTEEIFQDTSFNEDSNFIFVVPDDNQSDKILNMLGGPNQKFRKLTKNYIWNDLTVKTKQQLLQTKINFQNNLELNLMKILKIKDENDERDFSEIIDDELLNLLVTNSHISINNNFEVIKDFERLFQTRLFIKKELTLNSQKMYKSKLLQSSNHSLSFTEDELLKNVKNDKYIIISDIAGNGKTWMMKKMVQTYFKQQPAKWIVYVEIKQILNDLKVDFNTDFVTFMIDKVIKPKFKFEREIFKTIYKIGGTVIFFDGFNEVPSICRAFMIKLFKSFNYNGGNQLWVATRDYFEVDLQKELKVDELYKLNELDIASGCDMIAARWILKDLSRKDIKDDSRSDNNGTSTDSGTYTKFNKSAKQLMKQINLPDSRSIGYPLLFDMLAEISNQSSSFSSSKEFKVFKEWIKIHQENLSLKNQTKSCQNSEINIWVLHQLIAMSDLFPDHTEIANKSGLINSELVKYGLVKTTSSKNIIFVHQTIAEYFVADFLFERFRTGILTVSLWLPVLTKKKFNVVRMFLDDMLQEKHNLVNLESQSGSIIAKMIDSILLRSNRGVLYNLGTLMIKFIDKFYKIEIFDEFFVKDLKVFADLIISVLKKGNYEEVKKIINQNALKIVESSKDEQFVKFQSFLIEFLKYNDIKDLLIKQEIAIKIIQSNLDVEIFENFILKIEQTTNKQFIHELITITSTCRYEGNILFHLCWSDRKNNQQIQKFIKIIKNNVNSIEFLEMMKNCNNKNENVLQTCILREDYEKFSIFWTEIESLMNLEEFLTKLSTSNHQNIFHSAAFCEEIEIHKLFWNQLLITVQDREKLQHLLLQKDDEGYNPIQLIVIYNNSYVIEFTIQFLMEIFSFDKFLKVINSEDEIRRNLLQIAVNSRKDLKSFKFLWRTFQDFCDKDFLKIIQKVDKNSNNLLHGAAKSSTNETWEFIIEELEKIASRDEIRTILGSTGDQYENILQITATNNKNLKLHEVLWKTIRKYFDSSEIFNLIQHKDERGSNVFMDAVHWNSKEIVELIWNEIKVFLTQNELILYLKASEKISKLAYENKENPKVFKFLEKLLKFNEIHEDLEIDENQKSEEQAFIELLEAVKNVNVDEVESALKQHPDIDYEDKDNKNAIDHAWIILTTTKSSKIRIECSKIILKLLNANSKNPKGKFNFSFESAPKKIQEFIDMCESLHRDVENHNIDHLKTIINTYQTLRFYYDRNNESVLLYALKRQRINEINVMLSKLSIRHDESLNEIFYEFSFPELDEEFSTSRSNLPQPHILLLMSKSRIKYTKEPQKCWMKIYQAFLDINQIESCSIILKISAIWKKLRINFDFARDSNGIGKKSGTIIIGAKNLANESKKYEIYGMIAHELIHLAVQMTFMNNFNPFPMGESPLKIQYQKICKNIEKFCEENPKSEEIVKFVFQFYDEATQLYELIVTPMQMVVNYSENANKIDQNQRNFYDLFEYFKNVVIHEIEKAIPVLKSLQKENCWINFKDLTEPMKAKILHSVILFQGVETTLFKIIGDDIKAQENILKHLSLENIKQILLNDEKIEIVSKIDKGQERFIIDRNFVRNTKDNEADNDNKELTLKEIVDNANYPKMFILAESAGAGKSTTFKKLTKQVKDLCKSSWVSLVKLNESKETFNKNKENFKLEDILVDMLNLREKIEISLFKHFLKNGKLILLFDGFDEIYPSFESFVVKIFEKLTLELKNQILISTRPHLTHFLKFNFGVDSFKFSKLSWKEKSKFVNSILNKSLESEIPNELKTVFDLIENRKNEKCFNINNLLLIESIVKIYIENESIFNQETLNLYEIMDQVLDNIKEKLYTKIQFDDNFLRSRFPREDIPKVYALKEIIGDYLNELVEDLAITKNWKRESKKWEVEKIQNYGILTSNSKNIEDSMSFIHRIYAEFYLVEYLISFIFEMNFGIRFEEFQKVFEILKFIAESSEEFEITKRLLLDFVKINIENQQQKFDENTKEIIKENLSNIRKNILDSENQIEMENFWTVLLSSDEEILNNFLQIIA